MWRATENKPSTKETSFWKFVISKIGFENTQKLLFSRKKWWWFGGNAKFGAKYDFRNPENQMRAAKNLDEHNPLGFEAERALPWPSKLPDLRSYRSAPPTSYG